MIDIFPIKNTGIITSRDKFVVGLDTEEVLNRVSDFKNTDLEQARVKYNLNDVRERTLLESWNMIRKMEKPEQYLTRILYRPFDLRYLFYHHSLVRWPVYEVMHHMRAGKNLGFSTTRSTEIGRGWEHIFCSRDLIQHHTVSLKEVNYLFPLYLYPNPQKKELFDINEPSNAPGGRRPNLSPIFTATYSNNLNISFIPDGKGDLQETFGPEDFFDYMYAIFHSLAYRTRYSEFLKNDFPRLPLTSNPDLFCELCAIGDRLVELHLMEKYGHNMPNYPESGNNMVEKVEYTQPTDNPDQGQVWMNKRQYFDRVSPEVWEFHVGGYQVCQKWLKDRKGRTLSYDDIKHYQRIIGALAETITLMERIDEAIDEHGGWPIN